MPPDTDDRRAGGIKWETADAADALLSDLMADVDQEAEDERARLEAERQRREIEELEAKALEERRRSEEIEQRLREEADRRAQADAERQRLLREAAVARGEIVEDDEEPTQEPEGAAAPPALAEAPAPTPAPALTPAPVTIQAPPPPPRVRWGVTAAIAGPLLLVAAVLVLLFVKTSGKLEDSERDYAMAKTAASGLEQQVAAKETKLKELQERHRKLQKRLDDALAARDVARREAEEAEKSRAGSSGRRKGGRKSAAPSGQGGPKKKKKKGKDFKLDEDIFGKGDKIVY